MEQTDARLLARIGAGDQTAFARFYDRHADRVYRYCLARLRDPHRAADATQETMVAVWQGASRFAGDGSPLAWLFGIASRKVQDAWRRRGREPTPTAEPEPSATASPDPWLEQAEARLDVLEALACLPPEQQEVLLLTYYGNLSVREVAAATGVPEGTVKSRLYHARRALARAMGARG